MMRPLSWLLVLLLPTLALAKVRLVKLEQKAPDGLVEIRGVSAGKFDPAHWTNGAPNLVPTSAIRLSSRAKATSATSTRRRLSRIRPAAGASFTAGGMARPPATIASTSADTNDFITFSNRRTVIEHGPFQHVCNVSALRNEGGKIDLMCTAFPGGRGLNKPAVFTLAQIEPRVAAQGDLISMAGYPAFENADINGTNVLIREDARYRLYFNNFRDPGKTFRGSSDDGRAYRFDGAVLDGPGLVNDVKMFHVGQKTYYLMALHHNGPELTYSLSTDGSDFPPARDASALAGWSGQVHRRRGMGNGWPKAAGPSLRRRRGAKLGRQSHLRPLGAKENRVGPGRQARRAEGRAGARCGCL
jgi:hypothetical protein